MEIGGYLVEIRGYLIRAAIPILNFVKVTKTQSKNNKRHKGIWNFGRKFVTLPKNQKI